MAGHIDYISQLVASVYSGKIQADQSGAYVTIKVDSREKVKADLHAHFSKNKFSYEDVKTSKSSFAATKLKAPDGKDIFIIYKALKGGGSGAGAEVTELGESAQCWYTAVAFKRGKIDSYDEFLKHIHSVKSDCKTSATIEKILKDLPEDWIGSSIAIANYMLTMPQFKKNKQKFEFHRGSDTVNKINDMFLVCNRKESLFANINKWSPADIWLITDAGKRKINSAKPESFAALNALIADLYRTEDAVGVSLKKLGAAPHYEVFNFEKSEKTAEFKSYKITDKSKDGYMLFSYKADPSMTIQFRSFTVVGSWQGEIKGKYAAGGKIGGGQVAAIVSRISKKNLASLNAKAVAVMANTSDKKIVDGIIKYSKDIGLNMDPKTVVLQQADWLYSKYLTLELFSVFKGLTKQQQASIITEIVGYSASATEHSGVFIKIS